jgi:hypothetical protein
MKMIRWALSLLLLSAGLCFGDVRNVQDNYKFVYSVIDTSGNPVASETVALQIQRASDGYWYDFSDSTFKNSAWTSKTTNLTEDSTNGLYFYVFDPPASETGPEQYVFTIDNASATYGDHQSMTVTYQTVNTASVIVTTNNDKTGYTASTVSDKTGYSLTQVFPTNFEDLAIVDTTGTVTVGTNNDKTGYTVSTVSDKTGYSLSQSFPANFADLAITPTTGMVTVGTNNDKTGYTASTVSDKTGYSLTQSFPANFADLAITSSTGRVTVGTNADKTGYALTQAFPSNFADLAVTASTGMVTVGTNNDKTAYSISGTKTTLDALNDITAASVWTVATRALTDKDDFNIAASQTFSTTGAVGSVTAPVTATISDKTGFSLSAAGIDAIFDEDMTGHTTADTFGLYMQNLTYYTNGQKDGGAYNGIENMIRVNR